MKLTQSNSTHPTVIKSTAVAGACALALMAGVFTGTGGAQEAFADDATLDASAKTTEQCTAMLRLYNPYTGEHFYTASLSEKDNLVSKGWNYEGIGWTAPQTSNTPVYRLYNKYAGDHHYTLDTDEKNNLVKKGWTDEGIGWYSDDNKSVALLRQYNPNAKIGTHNFTTSTDENKTLKSAGWSAEGVSWYGVSHEYKTTTHPAVTHTETKPVYKSGWIAAVMCGKHDVPLLDLTPEEKCAIPGRLGLCSADPQCLAWTYTKYHYKYETWRDGTEEVTVVDKEAYTDTTCSVCGKTLSSTTQK